MITQLNLLCNENRMTEVTLLKLLTILVANCLTLQMRLL